ncbi:chromosome segregation protein [Vairimorpha apis BRL 01]|uniref:Chromosome segregation protein n=1 Tax=Vairimorpha apis BRL 01 TaxID=1037528 RepID=T0L529_9MICR|nr:chromosome segregation protein [Vairimorpha apis BRL 01]
MYIKDIILDGFKCYEEKTTIKNLDKFYNAITGLNGSGKSNIVDAIIFVLGLESRKLLRTNSLKELINVKRKDCKVTIVLNNSDKNKSPEGYVDYNEIIISRSYDFMGKSKFMLNNHSCSMNTIHKLTSKIKKIIFEDELSKNILSLKNYLENYIKDKNLLDEVEQRMNDLECIESDENNINIKEMLDDEKIKYDELKNNNLNDKLNYEHEEDKRKYFSLKSKINYTPGHNIFGTVDENINLKNEKYREAIFTILGNKAKYIIVNDEQTGSKLLKDSEKRVSVIPLSKINAKYIKNDLIRKVKNEGGIHAIDLVEFDSKYKKAMEHVFNGYFIFEYSDAAQKICYEYKIICVTLDGSIYDPKGTLTGGKLNYKIDIIKRSDIEILEKK